MKEKRRAAASNSSISGRDADAVCGGARRLDDRLGDVGTARRTIELGDVVDGSARAARRAQRDVRTGARPAARRARSPAAAAATVGAQVSAHDAGTTVRRLRRVTTAADRRVAQAASATSATGMRHRRIGDAGGIGQQTDLGCGVVVRDLRGCGSRVDRSGPRPASAARPSSSPADAAARHAMPLRSPTTPGRRGGGTAGTARGRRLSLRGVERQAERGSRSCRSGGNGTGVGQMITFAVRAAKVTIG